MGEHLRPEIFRCCPKCLGRAVVRLSLILSVRRVRTADQAGQDLLADPLLQPQQGLGEVSQLVEAADLLVDHLQAEWSTLIGRDSVL